MLIPVLDHILMRPGVQRLPTPKVQILQCREFLDDALCKELIRIIDQGRQPSETIDPVADTSIRTSETCDFTGKEPPVRALDAMLSEISGIGLEYGELMQGQRYGVGQQYKAHTDTFNRGGADWQRYCTVAGQRTWTFMVYLNAVDAGGGTRFKRLGKTFQPEAGKLLCWNNLLGDGRTNPDTLHQGTKVRKGTKYVITKWYREKPLATKPV